MITTSENTEKTDFLPIMDLEFITTLRCAVGMLGEKGHAGWWVSSFFSSASPTFITPLFPRTGLLAQCHGVTATATRVHDERIGVGEVFHLFRLPEDMERGVHELLQDSAKAEGIQKNLVDANSARAFLDQGGKVNADVGPTLIADIAGLREQMNWHSVAAKYAAGFRNESEVFPYFTDGK